MGSVAINPPKTPVTKGSNAIAAATVPNVCKMPGPPAPFVPAPLPNIGKSGDSPKDYSKKVKIEGHAVAIRGATFKSMGDMASKGTGGGLVSANTHGVTKFIGLGSLDTKIEGKNVHLLSDPMLNNCGPSGSPPNAATLAGVILSPLPPDVAAPGEPMECDHIWEEISSKTPEEAKKKNEADVAAMSGSPSMAGQMRGSAFENKAIDTNMEEMKIKKCSVQYKCSKCGQEQEVDIVGEDQVAEAKSRNFKQVKKRSDQARRIRDIQHKMINPGKNSRAKLDGAMSDSAQSTSKYLDRGFDVEVVPV
jgi:hypothetical protein